jgi:hypothetical protein
MVPAYAACAAKVDDLRKTRLAGPVGDEDLVDAAILRTQCFENRQNAVDHIRRRSVPLDADLSRSVRTTVVLASLLHSITLCSLENRVNCSTLFVE